MLGGGGVPHFSLSGMSIDGDEDGAAQFRACGPATVHLSGHFAAKQSAQSWATPATPAATPGNKNMAGGTRL